MTVKLERYNADFKESAVLLSYSEHSVRKAALKLNISAKILSKWRVIYQKFGKGSFPGRGSVRIYYENKKIFKLKEKLTESQLRLEILKKASSHIYQGKQELYHFIHENKTKYTVVKMCQVLGASSSTYYLWTKHPFSKREIRTQVIKKEIVLVFYEFKQLYGSLLIQRELHKRGYQISNTQVSFYMKQLGLRSKVKKKFKVTTNSRHNLFISPNVLGRKFKVDLPSKVWVSDITYIQIDKRFLYLTIIMDLYDRKIVGWNLSSGLSTKTTTLPALEMAVRKRKISDGLLFHSDRGVQYANKAFTNSLDGYKCTRSMSRKGDSLDNAVSESFFNSFKRELIHRQTQLLTPKVMRSLVHNYIENWYNKNRRHSALDYKTIDEFNIINKTAASSVGFTMPEIN